MLFTNPFKMPKPNQFSYTPRYYDERKERLQKMKEAAEAARDGKPVNRLEKGFLNKQRTTRSAAPERSSVLRRVVVIAIVLFFLLYVVFPRIDKFIAFIK